jgi:hypothetical protein
MRRPCHFHGGRTTYEPEMKHSLVSCLVSIEEMNRYWLSMSMPQGVVLGWYVSPLWGRKMLNLTQSNKLKLLLICQ